MARNEPKNVMVDIDWANQYTLYLMGIKDQIGAINNSILEIKQ